MGASMRHKNWPERLNKILTDNRDAAFAWGPNDCCSFAASVVYELTGHDFYAPFVGCYSSALTAAKILKKHGGVRGIATTALGNEIPPLTAGRGDIALVITDHGDTLAVCIGHMCVAPGAISLQHVPMSDAVTAWRVI